EFGQPSPRASSLEGILDARASRCVPVVVLRHAHISEHPTVGERAKVLQAMAEGDRSGRPGRWVAVPAAELCDDPSGPAHAMHGMRVLLERRPALELVVQAFEHGDVGGAEGVAGGLVALAVAGLHELQDLGRRPAAFAAMAASFSSLSALAS